MRTDEINLSIRRHEEEVDAKSWDYSEMACLLYRFFDLLNKEFFDGKLPAPIISFLSDRSRRLGWYRIGRNEFGLKDQINLNAQYLEQPPYRTLVTLLHEMIHQWQDYFGKHSASRHYHSRQFQTMAESLGIPCDFQGHTIGIMEPFSEFCRRYGVPVTEQEASEGFEQAMKVGSKSKLNKYSCGCTNIWAATHVKAVCMLCGEEFNRQ